MRPARLFELDQVAGLRTRIVEQGTRPPIVVRWSHGASTDPRYRLDLVIPGPLPDLAPYWRHWSHVRREAETWRELVHLVISKDARPKRPLRRAISRLERRSPREPDDENLAASFKALVDALGPSGFHRGRWLARADVLEGDNPRILQRFYAWAPSGPEGPAVHVQVEEVIPE